MSHHNRANAYLRANVPTDLAAYAAALRPAVATLRRLADEATARPSVRVYTRTHVRRGILRALRELETRIEAVAPKANGTEG
jgi:hypothetical protein